MKFDLHVHSVFSGCSCLEPSEIVETAREKGLDGVCITDHGTMDIRHHLREGKQPNGLLVLFGMEYATPDGDFLVFGPFEQLPLSLDAAALLKHVDRSGGVAIAAHPFRSGRPVAEKILRCGLCQVVEVMNGRNSEIENLRVDAWRKKYEFTEVAGSDAHTTQEIGEMATRFTVPVGSRKELIGALKRGCCFPLMQACSTTRLAMNCPI